LLICENETGTEIHVFEKRWKLKLSNC
jgi:hypothetical protein